LPALRDERFVLFPRQHAPGYYDFLVDICRRAGFDPKPVQESEKLHPMLSLVAMGRGVSLMPECVTAVGRKGVVCRPLRPRIPNTELGLVYNPATRSQLVRSFITLVKERLWSNRSASAISQAKQKDTALRP
jgi:DNA-binding transcriptional LysR family regulator